MTFFGRRRRSTGTVPAAPASPVSSDGREPVTRGGLYAASNWAWRALAVATLVALILWLLYQIKLVTISFIIGLLLTALLQPFVGMLSKRGVPRALSTIIVFLVGLGILVGLGFFISGQVSSNSDELVQEVQDVIESGQRWLAQGPLHVNSAQIQQIVSQAGDTLSANSQKIATGAVASLGTGAEIIAGLLLALFCTFFLLLDGREIWRWITRLFPRRSQDSVHSGGQEAWRTLSHYVRGTVIIAFMDALAVTITLLIAQVPLAVPVGVLVFLGAFIPVLGLAVTGAFAVALALVSHGLIVALIVLVVIVLAVETEGHVLQPVIMSRAVRVHPLGVLLAVAAGTLVAGIFGAVIAVPVVAVVNNVVAHRRANAPATAATTGSRPS